MQAREDGFGEISVGQIAACFPCECAAKALAANELHFLSDRGRVVIRPEVCAVKKPGCRSLAVILAVVMEELHDKFEGGFDVCERLRTRGQGRRGYELPFLSGGAAAIHFPAVSVEGDAEQDLICRNTRVQISIDRPSDIERGIGIIFRLIQGSYEASLVLPVSGLIVSHQALAAPEVLEPRRLFPTGWDFVQMRH